MVQRKTFRSLGHLTLPLQVMQFPLMKSAGPRWGFLGAMLDRKVECPCLAASSSVVSSGLFCFRDFLEEKRAGKGWLMDREWLGYVCDFPGGDLAAGDLMGFAISTSSSELDSVCTCWLEEAPAKKSWPPSCRRGGTRWGGAGADDGSDPLRCCRLEPKAMFECFSRSHDRSISGDYSGRMHSSIASRSRVPPIAR